MRQTLYKDFSLKLHREKWKKEQPNACQFELTFSCPLHCRHCYTDCYNKYRYIKKELNTEEILIILDKVYDSNALWLCLTGGDPLAREDFLKIYTYARKKGFIVTIFTSGILITEEIADYFRKLSPFCIELTLNSTIKKTYEEISGVKGSFEKAISAICRLKKRNIPFKIKTQVTKQNIQELDRIRDFIENLGLKFRPSSLIHARLNHDLIPYSLRIGVEEVLRVDEKFDINSMDEEEELHIVNHKLQANRNLFWCAAGTDTFYINPYGDMFLCSTVRKPSINLLKNKISDGLKLFRKIKMQEFKTDSKCKACSIRYLCHRCPGRAYLETGNSEMPIEYFCKLAHIVANRQLQISGHSL